MGKTVHLAYGEHGLDIDVPNSAVVLEPKRIDALPDAQRAIAEAIERPLESAPLREIVRAGDRVAIVVSDITRPVPNEIILPPILEVIHHAGIPRERVVIVIGTGLHRASTPEEIARVLGREIASAYEVVSHDARDKHTLAYAGLSGRGTDVWMNRRYLEAEVRVVVGFVEPHLFAGWSGGGKGIMPGVAGADTIMSNHGAEMIGHPKAVFCVAEGNPIFEEQRDIALLSEPSFCVNVTLNERREITAAFAGELVAVHDAGIAQAETQYVAPIERPFDIVVATNMGYPADLNLYQSVKGLSVAAQGVHEGGSIILAAECRDGLGQPEYVELLTSEQSPRAVLERINAPGHALYDQWCVQVQALVQAKADCWLHSSTSRETTESALLRYCDDVSATVEELRRAFVNEQGREPAIGVIPHGQLTVPRIIGSS